jgi:hypothetical protein
MVSLHEEADLASEDFPELVEQTRQASNDVCEKAKLVLRRLLPDVEVLQKDNASFSPRLMLLMLSRTGDQLSPDNRDQLQAVLQHAEAFQPKLIAWMMAVKRNATSAGTSENIRQCTDALELVRRQVGTVDALLATVAGGRRSS